MAKKQSSRSNLGHYAFLVGILIAIIIGLFPTTETIRSAVTVILVVLGIVVGLLNITARETTESLVAAIALMTASAANYMVIPNLGGVLQTILEYIVTFVAPAAIIVSLKTIKQLADA